MDVSGWKRDPDALHATLKELPNNSLVTTTGCKIYIQESFRSKQLIIFGKRVMIVGFYAMINTDGNYAVSTTPAMMQITPSQTKVVEIKGRNYYEFTFPAGSTVIKELDVVKDNQLLYYLFEEILARGRMAFFYDYVTMGGFFKEMVRYTGTKLVTTASIGEMIVAQIARTEANRRIPLRNAIKNYGDDLKIPYAWIPLRNVIDGSSDTVAKIAGSYTADGLDSAIVNPSDKVQPIERLLRS